MIVRHGAAARAARAGWLVLRTAWPLLTGYAAWMLAAELWGDLIAVLPPGSRSHSLAWNAWPTAALAGPVLVMAAALALRGRGGTGQSAGLAAIAMVAAAALLTAGPELVRLDAFQAQAPWPQILQRADVNIIMALAFGLLAATAGLIALGKTATQNSGVERAPTDAFGHADWMPMAEARHLFDASRSLLGGVVIGEAYRVDRDRVAGIPFDPRDRRTWGRGGKAPLLVFDLSWGGTHGLVFAGSGAFKTVSVCVPTLLCYRGPIVTLDPSAELAPMLTQARQAMGRRVIAIDPARPEETGFNALGWLDVMSPTIDADIRAVVEWIAGERPSESAHAPASSGRQFFEGRGKALIEALLSDLVFTAPAKCTLADLAARLALPEAAMREELQRIHAESSSPRARHLAGQLMGLVPETFSGVYGNMSEQSEWLANPRYAALLSGSAFTTQELAAGAVDLFLNIPLPTLQATPALARVIVGSLLAAVYRADGHLPGGRVVFLLDEVARLGPMAALARARDAGRKYGLTLVLLYQSEGQLIEQWGEGGKAAWFESASFRSYAAVSSPEQARALSEACGEHGILTASESASESRGTRILAPTSRSTGTQRAERPRRLVSPSEILADARGDEQFVFVTARKPLRCGRALYFRRPEMRAKVRANRFAPDSLAAAGAASAKVRKQA
jgi:type IV secretion system protein VirD4